MFTSSWLIVFHSKENEAADKISEHSETSDNDQDHGSYPDWDDCPPISAWVYT